MSLFVTYYGDVPYWDNTLLLPAYPSGYAYFRPFRYHERWIQQKLRGELDSKPAAFVGRAVILGMRFEPPADRLVPIREARLAAVEREDDVFVYFKLGKFFEFPDAMSSDLNAFSIPL